MPNNLSRAELIGTRSKARREKEENEDVMIASDEPEAIFGNIPKYITRASGEPAQRVTVGSVRVPVPSSFSPNSNQV